ncbi:hypothetical protein RND81_02G019400 [Saponaria officinalis]|uniref:Uncharacterized protein n=1 Tax=Saponaria officinalis TaxID=3572 RepID=A0AAW1MJ01_SAPOF
MERCLAKLVATYLALLFLMLSFAPPFTVASIQDGKQRIMAPVRKRYLRQGLHGFPPSPTQNANTTPDIYATPPTLRRFL